MLRFFAILLVVGYLVRDEGTTFSVGNSLVSICVYDVMGQQVRVTVRSSFCPITMQFQ